MQTTSKRPNKIAAVVVFLIALLFWAGTITHDVLGFTPPVNEGAMCFDLWAALVWAGFVYCALRLYRAFCRNPTGQSVTAPAAQNLRTPAQYTWTGDIVARPFELQGSQQLPQMPINENAPATRIQGIVVTGIRGWLLLLIVKLWVGAVVRLLGGFAGFSDGASLVALLNLGCGVLAGTAAYLLGTKNPKGVLLAKIYLAIDALYYLLALVESIHGAADGSQLPSWFKPAGFFAASLLYLAYLSRSKRVRNTYVPIPAKSDAAIA